MTTLISKTEARPNNASYGWHEGAFYFIPSPTDLDIGYMSEETYKTGHALRFPHFDMPPGQVIKNAYITYFGWSTYEGDFCNSKIYGEKALNPVSFSTWADFQARPKTDISVPWDAIPHWYPNVPFHSPNIAALIQEIIAQPGWAQGNPIVLFCDDLEGRSSAVHRAARHAWAYYEHFEWQPFLTVEYGPETNFAVLDIAYSHLPAAILITLPTTTPCHLTCYYTDKKPGRHKTSRTERGLTLRWGAYFCFVAWKSVEQTEAGDTLIHTFIIPDWTFCQTKWFTFRGTAIDIVSPSIGPIFKHHHSGQYLYEYCNTDDNRHNLIGNFWYCQTFTPQLKHEITKVSLKLWRWSSYIDRLFTLGIKHTDANGKPTGLDLCSAQILSENIPFYDEMDWIDFNLEPTPTLNPGTKYAIVVRSHGTSERAAFWRSSNIHPYPRGSSGESRDGGLTWTLHDQWPNDFDNMFEEYGIQKE